MSNKNQPELIAAIYARVSSDAQAQEQTIDSQVADLRQQATGDKLELVDGNCFLDDGVSGSTLNRPALERLRDAAYVGGFNRLYIHSPDRLARKTRVGPRRSALRTQRGHSKTPRRTGSTYDTDASEQLSIPVPPIVSEELFAAVEKQLSENRQRGRERKRGATYLLQGLLECKCCGYAYYGKKVSRSSAKGKAQWVYYRCVGTDAHRFGGTRVCDNKQVRTDKLDEAVWQDACELLRHPKLLRQEYERRLAVPKESGSRASLKKQLASAQQSVNRLIDAFADGVLVRKEFDPRLQHARDRAERFAGQLSELENETREQSTLRDALACLDDFTASIGANLDEADWTLRREILRTMIDRVLIEKDQCRIVYRINFPLFAKKASKAGKEKSLHFCWRSGFTTTC